METGKKFSTRNNILHAAKRLYEEQGLEEIKVSDIAKTAGVARATFFTHFRHLEDLHHAIGEEEVKHVFQYHLAKGGEDDRQRLLYFFETLADEALYAPQLFHKVIFQDYCSEAPLQKIRRKICEYVDDATADLMLGGFYSTVYITCLGDKNKIMQAMEGIVDRLYLK